MVHPDVPLSSRAVANASTPPRKPSVGQKKPLDTPRSSPPLSSKKQKVSDSFLDQSIEGLTDVTAVTGINLREEEEQLFSGTTGNSRVSEASNRVVQEEERLILQRTPLQKKLAAISLFKCGLKGISNDVEQCLSLCVEERLHGLVCNLISLSKQRVDAQKPRHQTLITSDVQQQIATINKKAREEKERKQAEVKKLPKFDEVTMKDDNKMNISAANAAVRAAVGGDDIMSKWQLMAEQASQKHGVMDVTSGSQAYKDMNYKPLLRPGRDNQEAEESPLSNLETTGISGRNLVASSQSRCARTISIKDVITVLERDPKISDSMLLYRLYNRIQSEGTAE